jgi:dienelactone hydrolase
MTKPMNKKRAVLGLLVTTGLALGLAACETSPLTMRQEVATRLASPAWMIKRQIPAGLFALTAYERMHTRFAPADVYIEGDGTAWLSKKRMSRNPTPKNPVALHLATRDKADNVAYLARPCQYSGMLDPEANCGEEYWTGKRYSPEVLAAYNAALDEMKMRYDISSFNLVGFSGGGTIAALLAAQRDDILSIRTVAGNLDHKAHSAYHEVSSLEGSLNPPEFAAKLATMPQYHFIGGQDEVVPPAVLHSYLQSLGPTSCVNYKFIQEAEHEEGWVDKWPELLALQPACAGPAQEVVEFEEFVPEPIITPRDPGNFK